jgi:apolipoprotein N-acyltransferase
MGSNPAETTRDHVSANGAVPSMRWALLLLGCIFSVLASGSRWDIALAAWIAPILVLRFSRTSSAGVAMGGALLVALLQISAYLVANAVPFNMMTVALGVIVSMAYASPVIIDRVAGARLSEGKRIFLLPAAMVVAEFGIGATLPLGTAVGMRAITQGGNLALVQILAITGPYVVAFMIGCAATIANRVIETPASSQARQYGISLVVVLAMVIAFGQARLGLATPSGAAPTVKVAAITPDLSARLSTNDLLSGVSLPASAGTFERLRSPAMRATFAGITDTLLDDTRGAARAGAKIVVWSETAAPSTEEDKAVLLARISQVAREERIYLNAAIGVPFERNEMFLFGPDGRQLWHYRKNHPVPGMEPVAPFSNAVPVVSTPYGRLAGLICFDGDFPALARVDAEILLSPSWDWPEVSFTHTMRMVRLRAIENGYAEIRPVFNGVAGAFDGYGRTLAMQGTMSAGTHMMIVDLPIRRAPTLYNRVGDVFAWSCAAVLVALLAFALLPGGAVINLRQPSRRA